MRKTVTKEEADSLFKKGGTKMMPKNETIKIEGYSVGDMSVGISSIPFMIDTGLTELSDGDRESIISEVIRGIWELHDNGNLHYDFSDEIPITEGITWDFCRRFTHKDSERILQERQEWARERMENLEMIRNESRD
jgi:hypothetical protein